MQLAIKRCRGKFCWLERVEKMPLRVQVSSLGGECHSITCRCSARVSDLKWLIFGLTYDKPLQQLLTCDREVLDDDDLLSEYAEDCHIAGLLPSHILSRMDLQLKRMLLAIKPKVCDRCGSEASQKCLRCKHARYCSAACQTAAWPEHRLVCNR